MDLFNAIAEDYDGSDESVKTLQDLIKPPDDDEVLYMLANEALNGCATQEERCEALLKVIALVVEKLPR